MDVCSLCKTSDLLNAQDWVAKAAWAMAMASSKSVILMVKLDLTWMVNLELRRFSRINLA